MTSWFDIKKIPIAPKNITLDKDTVTEPLLHSRVDQADLDDSAEMMLTLVEKEVALLDGDYSKVFIGGYGEGASVALAAFLKFKGDKETEKHLGGVLGLNGMQALNYTKAIKFDDSKKG
jgi:predicted esterase